MTKPPLLAATADKLEQGDEAVERLLQVFALPNDGIARNNDRRQRLVLNKKMNQAG